MASTVLEIRNLSFSYGNDKEVLHDVTFAASEGECIGLVGANGAGKSTLLKILVGLETGFGGDVTVCGISLAGDHADSTEQTNVRRGNRVKTDRIRAVREKIGYVFQDSDSQLFMTTVREDVAFGPRNMDLPEEEVKRRTGDALAAVGIGHLAASSVFKLSGGEKKLASIATILAMSPEILLMDEPSASLDPRNRRNLIHVLCGLPYTKLIACHDLDFILDTCSRCILLADGGIAADGPAEEILSDKELLERCGLELPLSRSRL